MLCSECKKNPAIIFFEKIEKNNKNLEGLCYDCAKKKGIDPLQPLRDQNAYLARDQVNLKEGALYAASKHKERTRFLYGSVGRPAELLEHNARSKSYHQKPE